MVAEDVHEVGDHLRRLAYPDCYRPELCARCLHAILHVHSYPVRQLRGDGGGVPVVPIAVYVCAHAECGATWRILPLFLARHLWRTWRTVERVVAATETSTARPAPRIPARTQRRWRERLASSARQLIVLVATSGAVLLAAIAAAVGLDATRLELVVAHARAAVIAPGARLAALAALVHRLEGGIRLM